MRVSPKEARQAVKFRASSPFRVSLVMRHTVYRDEARGPITRYNKIRPKSRLVKELKRKEGGIALEELEALA